jgi:FkbM family methyltransferase
VSPLNPDTLPLGQIEIEIGGTSILFQFPDTGNIRQNISRILSGHEYSGLPMRGYQASVIVDIGANVGASALWFHNCFPDARLYCYEPSPTNLRFLKHNVAPIERIHVLEYGLSDRDDEVKLFIGALHYMQNSVIPNVETQQRFEMAQLRRASTELVRAGIEAISILKLDTEGCEVPILRDIAAWIPAIDLAFIEYHSEEDRQVIEDLFRPAHALARAKSDLPHRGTNLYVARRVLARFPNLEYSRIPPVHSKAD